jgi:hypothetical protein
LTEVIDLAKTLLVASELSDRGVTPSVVTDVLTKISKDGDHEALLRAIREVLANDYVTPEDILQAILMCRGADRTAGMIDGLKEIRLAISSGALNTRESVEKELRKAVAVGKIDKEVLAKFLADSESTESEFARSLLIESALAKNGVTRNKIEAALDSAISSSGELEAAIKAMSESLGEDRITMDDIAKAMAMAKSVEGGGKMRGMKELMKLIEDGDMSSAEAVEAAIREALDSGLISQDVLTNAAVLQKALAASGSSPETVAKMIALQKMLAESGMPKHEERFFFFFL